jgi:glycolate oxidase iron-sulfur subunit
VQHLLTTDAEVVVSGNPGCLMQIASGLEVAERTIKTMHLIELVDLSLHTRRSAERSSEDDVL